MTGLSGDIIRVWERRYGVVAPIRGPRGARLYSNEDVEHLRLLGRAVGAGRAIGDVAHLDRVALAELTAEQPSVERQRDAMPVLRRLFAALDHVDIVAIDRQLGEALLAFGAVVFGRTVAAPFLTEIGERWSAGRLSVADEHLVSGVLRNILSGLVRSRMDAGRPTVLLATPSGERHEFGVLLASLLLLDAGLGVHYLGADLPAREIVVAARRAEVAVVGLGVVNGDNRANAIAELRAIESSLPSHVELWLGGREAAATLEELRPSRAVLLDALPLLDGEAERLRTTTKGRR